MSFSDPISDALTRIRNAHARNEVSVRMPDSKVKSAIANVLKSEGYIKDFKTEEQELIIFLKYYQDEPVITRIRRVSKPSLRIYRRVNDLPKVLGGLGIAIVSTSQGVMSDREAREKGQGGEILCTVE